jgi:SAM-dependent methyltransferase
MTPAAGPDSHHALTPSPWIVRHAPCVPAGARVLDLACGHGRNARYLADRGARVLAVDRDVAALATLAGLAGVATRADDLEGPTWPLGGERFDAVVVTNYLYRPRLPELFAALEDDGLLLYETFARGNEVYGPPKNPDFLLERGELLALARGRLTVIAFEEGYVDLGTRGAVVQRLAAVGLRRPWPTAPGVG